MHYCKLQPIMSYQSPTGGRLTEAQSYGHAVGHKAVNKMKTTLSLLSISLIVAACGSNEASIVTAQPNTGGNANSTMVATGGSMQLNAPNGGASGSPMNTGGNLSVSTATGGTAASTCVVGAVGCACYPNDTCNAGAQCFLGACLFAANSTGGASSTGGTTSAVANTGGTTAVNTLPTTGGAMTTGGMKATGGSLAMGGTFGTGGSKPNATGGNAATGGSPGTGGNMATGGSSSATLCGQSVCAAGQTCAVTMCPYPPGTCVNEYICIPQAGMGGSSSTGGSPSIGGNAATGGLASTGGAQGTGGTTSITCPNDLYPQTATKFYALYFDGFCVQYVFSVPTEMCTGQHSNIFDSGVGDCSASIYNGLPIFNTCTASAGQLHNANEIAASIIVYNITVSNPTGACHSPSCTGCLASYY